MSQLNGYSRGLVMLWFGVIVTVGMMMFGRFTQQYCDVFIVDDGF